VTLHLRGGGNFFFRFKNTQAVSARHSGRGTLPSNAREMFTEPLPSNDNGIFTETLPSNDKGIFTKTGNDKGDTQTHTEQHVLYFFKIRKVD
jgi:hypothetical protein